MEEKEQSIEERAKQLDRSFLDKVADSVKLNTRAAHLVGRGEVRMRCPLCHKRFEKMIDLRKILNPVEVYVCHTCKIGIGTKDPWVGNWEAAGNGKPIICPRCEGNMRFFCTTTGYWRVECWATISIGKRGKRRCGATLAEFQPDRRPEMPALPAEAGIDRPVATPDNQRALILPDETIH